MRSFLRAHWKALVAIVLLVLLAVVTADPGAATPALADGPPLPARLRAHVSAIASGARGGMPPARMEAAARYIEHALASEGYAVRRQVYRAGGRRVRNIEVSIGNVAARAKPERIFIIGAHCDAAAGAEDSGTAAVLELARLLKKLRPSQGTELKFVFFVSEGGTMRQAPGLQSGLPGRDPDSGNFIAFVGRLESARAVQDALSAFRAVSEVPAHGLAAPAYVQGVTLSDHASYQRLGYPAIMITDTAFLRYPYYHTARDGPDKLDYEGTARVVRGLARTIRALAAGQQG